MTFALALVFSFVGGAMCGMRGGVCRTVGSIIFYAAGVLIGYDLWGPK